ncbi:MAG: beta-lactamase family protein [Clostridia bacterium]|nr:beta-lactamase family protein [Clostridia bacterium]
MKILNQNKLEASLTDWLNTGFDRNYYAGVQLIVRQQGKIVTRMTRGVKDAWEGTPLPENTMFRLASMTKPVTGAATLLAVQKGWLRLEDDLADYIPEYKDMDVAVMKDGVPTADHKARTPIKIWHLLTHTSGIMSELPMGLAMLEQWPKSAFESLSAAAAYCADKPLVFDPGSYTAYTGSVSFDAVAAIIEQKSGMSYADFVDENLFRPLNIPDLTFRPTEDQWNRLITMHERTDTKTMITVNMGRHIYEGTPLTYTLAGAGLMGSLDSYSRFAEFLRGEGELDGVRLISRELFAELKKPWVAPEIPGRSPNESWGLGVRVVDNEKYWLPVGTFGWSGAYGTHFWVDPVNQITAVFLKNNLNYDSHGCGRSGGEFERLVAGALE